jgi:hypothetical protein
VGDHLADVVLRGAQCGFVGEAFLGQQILEALGELQGEALVLRMQDLKVSEAEYAAWKASRRIMKKPLIGSASVRPSTRWLRRVATALIDWREDCQSPTAPPSTKRDPTTISIGSSRSTPSMPGNSASSCCRSASMTAR